MLAYGSRGRALARIFSGGIILCGAAGAAPTDIYRVCSNNLRTRLWAQLTVDADLMQEEIKRIGLAPGHTQVAVLDTGFDRKHAEVRLARPLFKLAKGTPEAGDPEDDKNGHGTMVAGVIGGAGGIGVAPDVNLSVYRLTSPRADGVRSDALAAAVRAACRDGNEIINLSWGSVRDESGEARNEIAEKKLIAEMSRQGCLLVKAAGNSSYRSVRETDNLDDGYLRAGAINDSSVLSAFSSVGEVSAPGSFVFTLESEAPGHVSEKDSDRKCESQPGLFVNGTSFAAPITAGLAAEVLGVLKRVGATRLVRLLPADRILLVNRILKASEFMNSVNGLRAVLIAERWASEEGGLVYVPAVRDLAHSLDDEAPAFCRTPVSPYKKGEEGNYLNERRKRLSVCPGTLESRKAAITWILRTLVDWNDLEQSVRWLKTIDDETYLQKYAGAFKQMLDRLWAAHLVKWRKRDARTKSASDADDKYQVDLDLRFGIDFDEALAILPYYISTRPKGSASDKEIETALRIFLTSYDFGARLSRRNLRGSEEDLQRLQEVWRAAAKKTSAAKLFQIVSDWVKERTAFASPWDSPTGMDVLTIYRVLQALHELPGLEAIRGKIETLEFDIFLNLNRTNKLTLQWAAEEKPDGIALAFNDDINHYYAPYLDPFYQRHRAEILEFIGAPSGDFAPRRLNSFFLSHLLLSDQTGLDPSQRENLFLGTLETIAAGAGWNDTPSEISGRRFREDEKLTHHAHLGLIKLYRELKAETARTRIRERYNEIFESATNLDFYLSELPRASEWKMVSDENPLLNRAVLSRASARLFLGIPPQTRAWKIREAFTVFTITQRALPFLIQAEDATFTRPLTFAMISEHEGHRLRPPKYPRLELERKPSAAAVLSYFTGDWARLVAGLEGAERKTLFVGKTLFTIRWNREACHSLPPTGEWKTALEKLGEVLERGKYETHGDEIYENRVVVSSLLKDCGAR